MSTNATTKANASEANAGLDRALAALPVRALDPLVGERIRLRARLELRTRPPARWAQALGRGWWVAEPWVVGGVVVVFLGWTFERVSLLLVG